MKILLDTCSFLWALHMPSQLSGPAREAILSPTHSVHVSVVTFWEISLKAGIGKLRLEGVTPDEYPALAIQSSWETHNLTPKVASTFDQLPRVSKHRDPFDRLLIWTAINEGFVLVSGDTEFASYAPFGLRLCW